MPLKSMVLSEVLFTENKDITVNSMTFKKRDILQLFKAKVIQDLLRRLKG